LKARWPWITSRASELLITLIRKKQKPFAADERRYALIKKTNFTTARRKNQGFTTKDTKEHKGLDQEAKPACESGLGFCGLFFPPWLGQWCFEALFQGNADLAEMRVVAVFNRFKGIEHGGVDFQLNFVGESTHVFEILRGEQVLDLVEPVNDEVEPAIDQEHVTVNVRAFRTVKIWLSQVCLLHR
jgi:hypothetical protein